MTEHEAKRDLAVRHYAGKWKKAQEMVISTQAELVQTAIRETAERCIQIIQEESDGDLDYAVFLIRRELAEMKEAE